MSIINNNISNPVPCQWVDFYVDSSTQSLYPPRNCSLSFTNITDIGDYVLYNLFYNGTDNNTNVTIPNNKIDMSDLIQISGNCACANAFRGVKSNSFTVDLSNLVSVSGRTGINCMFYSSNLSGNLDLSNLISITAGDNTGVFANTLITSVDLSALTTAYTLNNWFTGCSNLISVDLHSLASVSNSDGNGTSSLFNGCSNLTTVDISNLEYSDSCASMFYGCSSLEEVDLSKLARGGSCTSMFYNCTSLTTVNLRSLEVLGNSGAKYTMDSPGTQMFANCSSLAEISFDSLNNIILPKRAWGGVCENMFSGCSAEVYFYNIMPLINDYVTQSKYSDLKTIFSRMCNNYGGNIHFPAVLEELMVNDIEVQWGSSFDTILGGGTVCYDLEIAVYDTQNNKYSRIEKYSDKTNGIIAYKSDSTDIVYYTNDYQYLYTEIECTNTFAEITTIE